MCKKCLFWCTIRCEEHGQRYEICRQCQEKRRICLHMSYVRGPTLSIYAAEGRDLFGTFAGIQEVYADSTKRLSLTTPRIGMRGTRRSVLARQMFVDNPCEALAVWGSIPPMLSRSQTSFRLLELHEIQMQSHLCPLLNSSSRQTQDTFRTTSLGNASLKNLLNTYCLQPKEIKSYAQWR